MKERKRVPFYETPCSAGILQAFMRFWNKPVGFLLTGFLFSFLSSICLTNLAAHQCLSNGRTISKFCMQRNG